MNVGKIDYKSPLVIAFLEKFGGDFFYQFGPGPVYGKGLDRYQLPFTLTEFYDLISKSVKEGKILLKKFEYPKPEPGHVFSEF
jgi:hypothetical protein